MKKITLLFLVLSFLGWSQVQIGDDIYGEEEYNSFGGSVSLSSDGTIVAIGAIGNDANGPSSGHVRIYENQNGSWVQVGQDINGENTYDNSGGSVSLSSDGSIVAIGAIGNDENGSNSGHVRIYENQNGSWVQVGQDINGEDIYDNSGCSVSLSSDGSIVAIGAIKNGNNDSASGHVRIYENQNGSWIQLGQDIDGESMFDQSGGSVSLSSNGSIVAIGAVYALGGNFNGDRLGHVRIYENQNGTWIQIGQDIDGEVFSENSGRSVSLSSDGNIVAIGADNGLGDNVNGDRPGHVRIYENQDGTWVQIGQNIEGETAWELSGWSVSLSSDGSIVAIGAISNDDNGFASGQVRIYKNQNGIWVQIGQDINGEGIADFFGSSVSLSSDGDIVAISANRNDINGTDAGQVKVFSIISELALLEVVEDILGNTNGINITANQLNSIEGVSGAIEGVNYTTALDNGIFVDENNPSTAEIQFIIDQVNETLSLNYTDIFSFSIYPNPAKNQFTIQLNPTVQLENVSVYNTLGQVVLTSEETIVDTSKLSSGSYVVEISTNKGKSTKQLIIK